MAKKIKWKHTEVIGKQAIYARATGAEIIVRVENVDTSQYLEYRYPKALGIVTAIRETLALDELKQTPNK
jgi:hypothetical protein